MQALRPSGRMIILAGDPKPLQIPTAWLITGRKSLLGWMSGDDKDSEQTMAFAVLTQTRLMAQTYPLEQAEEAYQSMGSARFRAVLTSNGSACPCSTLPHNRARSTPKQRIRFSTLRSRRGRSIAANRLDPQHSINCWI